MALNANDVNAGDDILAAHNNALIDDIEQHIHDGIDTSDIDYTASPKTRRLSISPSAAVPINDTQSWLLGINLMQTGAGLANATFQIGICLPQGAIVTKLSVRWFRDDAATAGLCTLYRTALVNGGNTEMAAADSDAATGFHTVEDSTITGGTATIDNTAYTYTIRFTMTPNDDEDDVKFFGGYIEYTIVEPLP